MADTDWAFPTHLQPNAQALGFDIELAQRALVHIRSEIPDHAFTAPILGTERAGNGIVIEWQNQTLILTAGYVVTEADTIWLTTQDGRVMAGHGIGYDSVTGFGLVIPLGNLKLPSLPLGSSSALPAGSSVTLLGYGGLAHCASAQIVARREFAGYWEYLLDDALIVAPPHPEFAGTALIDAQGRLVGMGSLLLQEQVSDDKFDVNLFIPIDLLMPILEPMLTTGQARATRRPWLGLYSTEGDGEVIVMGCADGGPAAEARLRRGDAITQIGGKTITRLSDFYRQLWRQGLAGCPVQLTIKRNGRSKIVTLNSASRDDLLLKPKAH